jgi:hypothetical protein
MARVYGMHQIVLLSGVNEEEFEAFVSERMPKNPPVYEGWKRMLLKGIRGDRKVEGVPVCRSRFERSSRMRK